MKETIKWEVYRKFNQCSNFEITIHNKTWNFQCLIGLKNNFRKYFWVVTVTDGKEVHQREGVFYVSSKDGTLENTKATCERVVKEFIQQILERG